MIDLAETIQQLRSELTKAIDQGEGESLRFAVDSIDLDLQVTVSQEGTAGGGIKFWLVDANAGAKVAKQSVQTIHLKLRPEREGHENEDVMVSCEVTRPSK